MLNGFPLRFFHSNRGIRQGDPLSPYIFVLDMKYWSISKDIALASGRNTSIKRGPHNYVTHLFFVDDMLIFVKANKSSLKEIGSMLANLGALDLQ